MSSHIKLLARELIVYTYDYLTCIMNIQSLSCIVAVALPGWKSMLSVLGTLGGERRFPKNVSSDSVMSSSIIGTVTSTFCVPGTKVRSVAVLE